MSHTLHPLRRQRLQRSTLAVPGSNPSMIEKAADSAADVIFLDLEDAVAPPEKEKARKNIIQALNDIDWKAKGKTMSVRINGLDTHYMYRDVVDVVEQAGHKLDTILVPKVACRQTCTWSRPWSTRSRWVPSASRTFSWRR
jgi:citrate lyase beta subunit